MKNQKILICFNSPSLGGAERSMIHQSMLMNDEYELNFCIPSLGNEKSCLESYLLGFVSIDKIQYLKYPQSFYRLSRKKFWSPSLLFIPFTLMSFFFTLRNIKLTDYRAIWLNGNKIAIPFLALFSLFPFKGRVVWHHRDYFAERFAFLPRFLLRKVLSRSQGPIIMVSNSYSVQKQLQELFESKHLIFKTIYNPSGLAPIYTEKKLSPKVEVIGLLAMMAPWKGLHQIILMAKMYRKELISLGVKRINIYGDEIYHTKGDHLGYLEQLKILGDDNFFCFKGHTVPEKALSEIDLLIHSSLKPEPFGRVILEAFLSRVPVISTGCGGAAELVDHKKTGLVFYKYDYHGLFELIKFFIHQETETRLIKERAFKKGLEIEAQLLGQLNEVLKESLGYSHSKNKDWTYDKNTSYI